MSDSNQVPNHLAPKSGRQLPHGGIAKEVLGGTQCDRPNPRTFCCSACSKWRSRKWRAADRLQDEDRSGITYVAVYSGARLTEICQLTKEEVRQEWGVWIIDINGQGGKAVKNEPSNRKVPIHVILIEVGFLDYVAKAEAGIAFSPALRSTPMAGPGMM